MKNILIIEDNLWISNSLKLYLENSWFITDMLVTWENAVEEILSWKYSLIILDINLPVKDGISICSEVRKQSNIPIVILTARDSELDKIIWLELWADDYISKPFSPRELLARINTILRRFNLIKSVNDIIIFKDIEMNIKKITIKKSWKEIILTKNEFEIFKKILQENWEMVPRETLMKDIIWYENYAIDRTIDTHIKNIRKKLDDKDIILTVRWLWYKLNK